MTRQQYESMRRETDAHLSEIRSMPGYEEVLADVRAEVDAKSLMATIIDKSTLTQREIASRMNVSQPYVSQLRRGRKISLTTLFRLASACGVKLRITAAL